MNDLLRGLMAKATELTRKGQLGQATVAIQQALQRAKPEGFVLSPQATAPPTSQAGGGAHGPRMRGGMARAVDVEDIDVVDVDQSSPEEGGRFGAVAPCPATGAPALDAATQSGARHDERWIDGSFAHQGRTVGYKLYLPPSMAGMAHIPRPMVVMLHGCTQGAADFAMGTRMHTLARDLGVIVLYPEQDRHANPQKCWNWFKPQHQQRGRGEPAVLAALAHSIALEHAVDSDRVFVAGLSAGGAMAEIMGRCYPDVFAAVGVHSGLPAGAATDVMTAFSAMRSGSAGTRKPSADGPAPPTIVFHGDADGTVHVNNGAAIVEAARMAHGLTGASAPAARKAEGRSEMGQRYTRAVYSDASGQSRIEYWQLHGAGHAWSGGDAQASYTDPAGVDASAEMLRFFLANRKRD